MLAVRQRGVERVEQGADLVQRVRLQHSARTGEQPGAPTAGVGIGARGVEEDRAGLAERVGEGRGEHGETGRSGSNVGRTPPIRYRPSPEGPS